MFRVIFVDITIIGYIAYILLSSPAYKVCQLVCRFQSACTVSSKRTNSFTWPAQLPQWAADPRRNSDMVIAYNILVIVIVT
jgi:hypothetical protein